MKAVTNVPTGPAPGSELLSCPSCETHAFRCEACLHQHMLGAHDLRYSEVYGQMPSAWSDPCPAHATMVSLLGL
ncbi:MAG: hypothetical protein R3185_08860 [Candidatus Thermoplasmatota archaeon]|nr:hypothetical protein [Candidatus Thermoplasmatota archaeon]